MWGGDFEILTIVHVHVTVIAFTWIVSCVVVVFLFQALAQLADGSVAGSVPVMVKVTINNDVATLFEDELLSEEEEGTISLDIAVPTHAKCMKISVSENTCNRHVLCRYNACTHNYACAISNPCIHMYACAHTLARTHACTHAHTHTHTCTCTHTNIS